MFYKQSLHEVSFSLFNQKSITTMCLKIHGVPASISGSTSQPEKETKNEMIWEYLLALIIVRQPWKCPRHSLRPLEEGAPQGADEAHLPYLQAAASPSEGPREVFADKQNLNL